MVIRMNILPLLCFYSFNTVFHSTSGQHFINGNALTQILTELKNLQEAQKDLVKSSEHNEHKSRVLSLQDTVNDLHDAVNSLQNENKELISVIHRLQHEREHFYKFKDNDIKEPNIKVYGEEIDYKKVERENVDMAKKQNERRSMVKRAFTLAPTLPTQQSHIVNGHVAFTAGLSASETALRQADTVIFDTVFANIGDAYNANTGIITAPTRGAYFLSVAMSVENRQMFYLQLVREGAKVTDIYADSSHSLEFTSTTKELIIELNKGDTVWVRSGTHGELHGNLHTMITGFLLFETNTYVK